MPRRCLSSPLTNTCRSLIGVRTSRGRPTSAASRTTCRRRRRRRLVAPHRASRVPTTPDDGELPSCLLPFALTRTTATTLWPLDSVLSFPPLSTDSFQRRARIEPRGRLYIIRLDSLTPLSIYSSSVYCFSSFLFFLFLLFPPLRAPSRPDVRR